jgi:glycosyltransferase involved in cell wall biosynthesis
MKFCFFNTVKAWGGGEKWHFEMALACRDKGHQVVVVASQDSVLAKMTLQHAIPIEMLALSGLSFLNTLKKNKIRLFFAKEKFDVVVFNSSADVKAAVVAAHLAQIPKIVYRRGSAIPIKNSFLNRKNFRYLTHILANSEATKRSILQNNPLLFPKEKIIVIYNGIDLSRYGHQKNIPNEIPRIGNLGRCVFQKGQDLLLQIAAILKNKDIACRFVIGGDGVLLEQLKKQSVQLGISEMVEFVGFVESPNDFLQSIDIFALTSRWEGFGYVIAEAMACNKPVAAFDISSNPELIVHGETGLLVAYPDVQAFALAIEQLILNKIQRQKLCENALSRVEKYFDFHKNTNKTIAFFESK